MAVIKKHELLKSYPQGLAALVALTWDQQSLIDFILLPECNYSLGFSPSAFSMNFAPKKHIKAESLYARPWRIGGDGDGPSWLLWPWLSRTEYCLCLLVIIPLAFSGDALSPSVIMSISHHHECLPHSCSPSRLESANNGFLTTKQMAYSIGA
ncbi:hypothetical protein VTI74DRAFT_11707 [Chaetomium olivicolor]